MRAPLTLLKAKQRTEKKGFSGSKASSTFMTRVVNVFSAVMFLQQQLAQLQKEKSEILKNLALYYFTFVDVMEFKVGKHIQTHS